MVKLFCCSCVMVAAFIAGRAAAQSRTPQRPIAMTPAKWHEDLEVYREQMPKQHGGLFHHLTREQFDQSINAVEEKLPRLTSNQVKVELMRLVAMVQEGHTRVRQNTFGDHMLPVRLHFFADGLYVEAGDKAYADVVGGKVIRIGSLPVAEAYARVRALVPVEADNEGRRELMAPELLVTPEILQGVGAVTSDDAVGISVEKGGRTIREQLPAGPFRLWNNHGWPVDPEGWVNARSAAKAPTPLWLQHTDKNYWGEFLPDGTLYLQFNSVADQPGGEAIAAYFPRVIREAAERHAPCVVLDLRLNGGGDLFLNRPIWHALLINQELNQKGKLWVAIGPKTFSAAMSLVDELEMNTQALFVGEPSGETPNMRGDPVDIRLPNSGIVIQAATLWWQAEDPRDKRPFRSPNVAAPLTFEDFAGNVDPVMQTIEEDPSCRHDVCSGK